MTWARSRSISPAVVLVAVAVAVATGCAVRSRPGAPARDGRDRVDPNAIAGVLHAEASRRIDDGVMAARSSDDPAVRRVAVRALGRIGGPGAVDALAAAAADPDPGVRAEAIRAIDSIPEPPGTAVLHESVGDSDPRVRAAVADALGRSPRPGVDELLLRLLDDPDPDVRVHAASASGGGPVGIDVVRALIRLSRAEEPAVREASAIALADLGLPGSSLGVGAGAFPARRAARDRLIELAADPRAEIRVQAARGLAVPISETERAALTSLLDDRSSLVRVHVLRSFAYPGAPILDRALALFDDPDLSVVAATFDALGAVGGMEAYRKISTGFLKHRDTPWLLVFAIRALFAAEREVALLSAKQFTAFPEAMLRAELCRSLGRVSRGGPTSVNGLLEEMARLDVPEVRAAALEAIARSGAPFAELPDEVLADDTPRVRAALARAAGERLREFGSPEIRDDALSALESTFPDSGTETSAIAGFDRIEAAAAAAFDPRGRAVLERAALDGPAVLRDLALRHLAGAGPTPADAERSGPDEVDAAEIARWAARPRAAIVTVERPGFAPGRFVVALEVDAAPMAARRFALMADNGTFDGMAFEDLVPGVSIRVGDPADPALDRCDRLAPEEPAAAVAIPAGAVIAVDRAGGSGTGAWSIALVARAAHGRPATVIGRVVQNFAGVVARILPGDRIVSIEVVEGDGTEPLPPIRGSNDA